MPHAPRLTPAVVMSRLEYLRGQVRRGNIVKGSDIEKKIRSNTSARENEIEPLKEQFIGFMRERGRDLCADCDVFTIDSNEYDGRLVCNSCYHRLLREENARRDNDNSIGGTTFDIRFHEYTRSNN